MDSKKVIKALSICVPETREDSKLECSDCPYGNVCNPNDSVGITLPLICDIRAVLKEQDEQVRKLQKDKNKLCLDVSKWKHKFHDAPPQFVSQGVVDQIRWERDTALSQLEQIGKGLGSKMDDIVDLLKKQKAEKPIAKEDDIYECCVCGAIVGQDELDASGIVQIRFNYCQECEKAVEWK